MQKWFLQRKKKTGNNFQMSSSVRISLNREPFVQLVDCNKNKYEADQLRETCLIFPTQSKKELPRIKSSTKEPLQVPTRPRESNVLVFSRNQSLLANFSQRGMRRCWKNILLYTAFQLKKSVCWLLKRLVIQKNVSRGLFSCFHSDYN